MSAPFWGDVGVKKWSPFFNSGAQSPIFGHQSAHIQVPKNRGNCWTMGLNSRCSVVLRTSTMTIFGSNMKIIFFRFLGSFMDIFRKKVLKPSLIYEQGMHSILLMMFREISLPVTLRGGSYWAILNVIKKEPLGEGWVRGSGGACPARWTGVARPQVCRRSASDSGPALPSTTLLPSRHQQRPPHSL